LRFPDRPGHRFGRSWVEIFGDRVEIDRTGRFPGIATTSDPLHMTRFARNPRIARRAPTVAGNVDRMPETTITRVGVGLLSAGAAAAVWCNPAHTGSEYRWASLVSVYRCVQP
jgi:hypothetical protein